MAQPELGPGGLFTSRGQITRANRDPLDKMLVRDSSDTGDGSGGTDKWQYLGDIAPILTAKTTAQYTNSTTTSSDITGLAIAVKSGRVYQISAVGIFRTAATTTGLGLNFTGPAVTYMSWRGRIQQAAAGTDHVYEGTVVGAAAAMPTTRVVSTAVVALGTDYMYTIDGLLIPSADGTLQLQGSSEVAASQITIQAGAVLVLTDCG